ncbi:uncharacterized protein LOC110924971 [Helianthus annuus]|uniref:uncharacterized protein LOC110924971 n=1 Tax=Helianthus annuus TaxID=4232 RepID=UPI000B8F487A|nr:uncharacterized protein LOC110924971 [Helianthus annuus]
MTSTSATLVGKIDAGDPLFLHPSDSANLTIVSVKLKGLEIKIIEFGQMLCILHCRIASDVWKDLKETYNKIDGSVVFNLYQKINSFSQNGILVSEYYRKLNCMWKQLDQLLALPACSCDAYKQFNDFNHLIKLMQFLMGLDSSYQSVRTNLLTRETIPSVKDAFSIISREKSHLHSKNISDKTLNNATAHTIEKCFELVGYPSWMKSKPSANKGNKVSNNDSADTTDTSSAVGWIVDFGANQNMVMTDECLISQKDVSEFNIKVSQTKKVQVTGSQFDGLYFCGSSFVSNKVSNSSCDINLRHARLGHPAEPGAKQHREPFPLSDHKTMELGDLIHLDVSGPYRVQSRDGFRYFLTVVDDYTRAVDVRFYETVFPFKEKKAYSDLETPSEVNILNFFYLSDLNFTQGPQVDPTPNDENTQTSTSTCHGSEQSGTDSEIALGMAVNQQPSNVESDSDG